MVSVGAYLKKLLYQYDCVVVPELGGFLTHYQRATYVAETGQFLPPRKRLAFNEALRLDDGILTNYIMLHESLTREEALRRIGDFVNELRQHVQLAGSFSVEGIGLFTPNVEGKLQFDPELRHNFFGESFGMSAVQAERVSVLKIEEVEAEEVAQTMALGPVLREEVLEQTPFVRVSRPRPLLRWVAAAALVCTFGALSYLTVVEPGQAMESSLNPANWFRIPSWLKANLHREVKAETATPVMVQTAREPSPIAMATPAPALPEPTPAPTPTPVAAEVVTPDPAAPAVVAKPVAAKVKKVVRPVAVKEVEKANPFVAEALPESAPETAAPKAEEKRTAPLFTVIAGSFASKQNAVRFQKTLQKAGYADAYVIQPTRRGQLFKVAAIGSPVREEAVASTDSLKKLTGITPFLIKN